MKKIVITNNKGGVGKTTSTFNIGHYFAKKGLKTLLIDLDPQGNLSEAFSSEAFNTIVLDAMKAEDATVAIYETGTENLHLMPSDIRLENIDSEFYGKIARETYLQMALENVEDHYDVCIMDTNPGTLLANVNALVAADAVYIPLGNGAFEMGGATNVLSLIKNVQRTLNKELKIGGFFITKYDSRTNLAAQFKEIMEERYNDLLLESIIRNNIQLVESVASKMSIYDYKKTSNGAIDYTNLSEEILEKEGLING